MKPGSLVVCLKIPNINKELLAKAQWMPIMDENTPYVIREMVKDKTGYGGVMFEEGIIGYSNNKEIAFSDRHVREIQPPCSEEISEICRDAQENYSLIEK